MPKMPPPKPVVVPDSLLPTGSSSGTYHSKIVQVIGIRQCIVNSRDYNKLPDDSNFVVHLNAMLLRARGLENKLVSEARKLHPDFVPPKEFLPLD